MLQRFAEVRRSLPAAYWVVWVGTLVNRAGGFVAPLLTFYLINERSMTLTEAGAIVSLFGAGAVIAGILGGVMADRLGRRFTMVFSMLGGAALMLALGFVHSPAAIAGVTFVLGFVGELYRPAVAAFIADVVEPEQRTRAYGLLYWAINIGFSIAPIAAGLVAARSYTALFVVDAVTMAMYGLFVLVRVPETRPAQLPEHHERTSLGSIFRDRTFVALCGLTFVVCFVAFQSTSTLSGWMASQGHGVDTFGFVIAVNGILIVLFQPFFTERTKALRPSRVLAAASFLTGLGFALHGSGSAVALHVAAVATWTFGEIAFSPIASTIVAALAPPDARGRYQGVFAMSWAVSACTGPLAGPFVLEHAGPTVLFGGCLAAGATVAVAFVALHRQLDGRARASS